MAVIMAMYSEAAGINFGITNLFKTLISRARPFLYNSQLPMFTKREEGKNINNSFFAGHTSFTFMSAGFLTSIFAELFPRSGLKFVVGIASFSLAALTGYLQYEAGRHFPTDLIVGAIVGTIVGVTVPLLHTL